MITLAVANSKGGVGKTSTAVHLATGFAREGSPTLLVDLDPQGNATTWLLGRRRPEQQGIANALIDGELEPPRLVETEGRGPLWIAPASSMSAGVDLILAKEVGGETVLRTLLQRHRRRFRYVVIDCPPDVGLMVLSAICAADWVIAPALAGGMSLDGICEIERIISRARERLHVRARMLGYLLFAADQREAVTEETREALRVLGGEKIFGAEVRVSTAAKTLFSLSHTAWDGDDPRGQADYTTLLEEIHNRLPGARAGKGARS